MKRRFASLASVLFLLAACGGTAAPTSTAGKSGAPLDIATYQGADRQQMLEAGARKEGTLTWYTSLAGPIIDRQFAGFKQKYPFIQPEVYRAADNELLARATQEAQGGKNVFDVLESPPTAARLFSDAKLLARYYSPSLANFPQDFVYNAANGTVETAVDRVQYVSFAYNTKVLAGTQEPKTIDDLMKPEFTGKIGIAGSTTGPRWVGSILQALGQEKGKQWLAQFASQQKPKVYQMSGTSVLDLIAKGEIPASTTVFESDALRVAKEQGAPVKWLPLGLVMVNPGELGLDAKAPHPYAALLFLDYLLGDGQKTFADIGMHTAGEQLPVGEKLWLPEQGKTAAQIETQTKLWTDLFSSTFR